MNKFVWGKVIDKFDYDFDGIEVNIVKYHPWMYEKGRSTHKPDMEKIEYYCEEISQSSNTLMGILLSWIVYRQLGMNQDALVTGLARMLKL